MLSSLTLFCSLSFSLSGSLAPSLPPVSQALEDWFFDKAALAEAGAGAAAASAKAAPAASAKTHENMDLHESLMDAITSDADIAVL